MRSRLQTRAAVVTLALLVAGACGKKSEQTQTSGGAIASGSAVQVADVKLGHHVGPDKKVTDETDTFAARDTVYATVHTTGSSPNAILVARWLFQDGQVVNESSENISPSGDAYTEFHVFKPSGWPRGKYTVHILMNGQEVQSKDFTVK